MLVDGLALAFPVALVAHDILQVFVALDIVLTYDVGGVFDHLFGDTRLAGDLDGKRRAGLSDGELEEGLHLMTVVEHRTVHHAWMVLRKVLQVLFQNCFSIASAMAPPMVGSVPLPNSSISNSDCPSAWRIICFMFIRWLE